ncbi:MAG: cation-translocating P-type ATPase [Candidatus Woesearchaeota archaeon]
MKTWHALSDKEVLNELKSSTDGLRENDAKLRLSKYGKNELKELRKIKPFMIFLSQFNSVFIYLLIAAAFVSGLLSEWINFVAILVIVFFNAGIGFFQNYKAEKSIRDLKKLLVPKVKVLRGGVVQEILAVNLVPGDILILNEGDKIVADCRVLGGCDLQVNEAVLTGESVPVTKTNEKLAVSSELTKRVNMLYSGTSVVNGSCRAVVVATGMDTEFGKIAKLVQKVKVEKKTPLQNKVDKFGKKIGIGVIILAILIGAIGLIVGLGWLEIFFMTVSLAVAAVPEGLPAVITIALAIAVVRMYKSKALIRKLPAAETLGRVNVICTDKTGTLTEEKMEVSDVYYDNKFHKFGIADKSPTFNKLMEIGLLCNNVDIGSKQIFGDPTEVALVNAGILKGFDKKKLEKERPEVKEFSFSSIRKLMSVVRKVGDNNISYVKGAPDTLIGQSSFEMINGKIVRLTHKRKKELYESSDVLEGKGLRVLAFGFKKVEHISLKEAESDLIFVGLQAMIDPPRSEVKNAIITCKNAGIAVKMVTGDSELTAATVGKMIGLDGGVVKGSDIEKMSDADLDKVVNKTVIFARATPEHKLRIVDSLKRQGLIVGVTGDGVNDVPALKKGDIGIAMGIRGTDVARDISDMVLTDDNFATVPKAVREGRRVFDNIKKFSYFLLSGNLAELFIILFFLLFGGLLGWPGFLALLPIQILWVNLVSDGIIAMSLGFEPHEKNIMRRGPDNTNLFTFRVFLVWLGLAGLITAGSLFLFGIFDISSVVKAQTVVFCSLVLFEGFNALNFRSFKEPIYKLKKNLLLFWAILISFGLQILIVQVGFFGKFFGTTPLTLEEWLIILLVSFSIVVVGEVYKKLRK